MQEEHVFDLIPCYVLGALDEAETTLVSEHLSTCEICRKELQTYTDAPLHLGMAVPRLTPSADLKARVLCRVNSAAGESNSTDEDSQKQTA